MLIKALRNQDKDVRLTCNYRWLVWSEVYESWVVYERNPYKKSSKQIIATLDLNLAVEKLMED